jgi:hypothetical protein
VSGRIDVNFTEEHTMRADIVPGGAFPDYELTDHTKTRRRLSELQGIDPMILILEVPPLPARSRTDRNVTSRYVQDN